MIKRIIFDLDNTLIMCDENTFVEPCKKALERFNIFDIEKARLLSLCGDIYETQYKNYNRKDFLSFITARTGLVLDDNFLDVLFEELGNCAPDNLENEKQTLEYLHEKYELVVLTNYFKNVQANRLKKAGLLHFFQNVSGEDSPKPNKEAYTYACGNHKPNECVMIGDNYEFDFKSPRKFGLHSIWLTKKEASNKIDIINNISELKDIL